MTGIVLCEISSGLSISPVRIPDGIIDDDTPVTFTAVGATGDVTWSMAPPTRPVTESAYSGRTLTDNGDGTATLSGTFTIASYLGFKSAVWCWDSVGQVARTAGDGAGPRVVYSEPLTLSDPATYAGDYQVFVRGGPGPVPDGPQESTYSWIFSPPLPAGWSAEEESSGQLRIHPGAGTYIGRLRASVQINLQIPEETLSASIDITLPL